MKSPYFCIGTGRCGTQLLSKVFSESTNSECFFQRTDISYDQISAMFHDIQCEFHSIIFSRLLDAVRSTDLIYGESSNHLFFLPNHKAVNNYFIPKYIFIVRDPIDFVISALARGFYDPYHRGSLLTPLLPTKNDLIHKDWNSSHAAVKSIWYWAAKNDYIFNSLTKHIPQNRWRVLLFSDISNEDRYRKLFDFLELDGFDKNIKNIRFFLRSKVNASPDPHNNNIYSVSSRSSQRMNEFKVEDLSANDQRLWCEILNNSITYNKFFK